MRVNEEDHNDESRGCGVSNRIIRLIVQHDGDDDGCSFVNRFDISLQARDIFKLVGRDNRSRYRFCNQLVILWATPNPLVGCHPFKHLHF